MVRLISEVSTRKDTDKTHLPLLTVKKDVKQLPKLRWLKPDQQVRCTGENLVTHAASRTAEPFLFSYKRPQRSLAKRVLTRFKHALINR